MRQVERRKRGRPPVDGEPANERLWLRLTIRQRAALDRVAQETGQTLTEVLREAVNEFVADYTDNRLIFLSAQNSSKGSS